MQSLVSCSVTDRPSAACTMLRNSLWCPEPEDDEDAEIFVSRLAWLRAMKPRAELLVIPGFEAWEDGYRWSCLTRAAGWAQQKGMVPASLGRPFCQKWKSGTAFAELAATFGCTSVEKGEEIGEMAFFFPGMRFGIPPVRIWLNVGGVKSTRDLGAIEFACSLIAGRMQAFGGGAGIVRMPIVLASPREGIPLVDTERAIALLPPRFTFSKDLRDHLNR